MQRTTVGLIVLLALGVLVAPLASNAQQPAKVPRVGVLRRAAYQAADFEAFTQGLRALGYIEGQNLAIEQRYAEGVSERLPTLAAELVRLMVTAAQPRGKLPMVGVLDPGTSEALSGPKSRLYAFLQGLQELGYIEEQTIHLEYRFADEQWDRLPALAAELVQRKPDVIVTGGIPAVLATKQATTTIPIVMAAGGDLVELGVVANLARPGGNITGQILRGLELEGKRLEMLKDTGPTITSVAVLVDAEGAASSRYPSAFAAEAQALGVRLHRVDATPETLDAALVTIATSGTDALLIQDSPRFNAHRQRILDFARTHRLPTACGVRAYAEAGCLIAYAPDILAMYRRAAVFVDKILKGTQTADLPLELPHKLELWLNVQTAQALGITFPPALLRLADEVIK